MDCKHLFRRKGSRTAAYSCSTYLAVCLLPGSTWLYALSLSFAELSAKRKCVDCKCRCYVFRLSAVNLFTCVLYTENCYIFGNEVLLLTNFYYSHWSARCVQYCSSTRFL